MPAETIGPTVWSGAWPTTESVELGPVTGVTAASSWSSWIQKSVVTSGTYVDNTVQVLGSSTYEAAWSSAYETPAPSL